MRNRPVGLSVLALLASTTLACSNGDEPDGGAADAAAPDAAIADGQPQVFADAEGHADAEERTDAEPRADGGGTDAVPGDVAPGQDRPVGADVVAADALPIDAYAPSAELTAIAGELGQLRSGQPADLDRDGTDDTTRMDEGNGAFTTEQDLDGDGTPEWRFATDGAGRQDMSVDADGDGTPEREMLVTVTQAEERVVLTIDTDLDLIADRRLTWITTATNTDEQRYIEDQDSNGDGTWERVNSSTISKTKLIGDPCMDGFPSSGVDWNPFPTLGGIISIRTGSGSGGTCDGSDALKIAEAVDCAISKGGLCLANTNSQMNAALNAALNGDSVMPLVIGCGNGCPDSLAATKSWRRPWFSDSKMNMGDGFFNMDANGRCNIMLHEMLHWAGAEGSGDHNSRSGPGNDDVYSCGRYCGNCSDAGHGSPNNSSVDCARCADTKARKEACGAQTQFETAPCGDALTGICHAGLACILGNCEQCGGVVTYDCDGNILQANASCCAQCPANCNRSNDLPCGAPPASTDTCMDGNPPACP